MYLGVRMDVGVGEDVRGLLTIACSYMSHWCVGSGYLWCQEQRTLTHPN